MSNQQTDLVVKMNLTAWEMQNKRFNEFIEKISDEQLLNETAPGRNTGVYLLGHITAVSDDMFRLLGSRDKMFPAYAETFIKNPDKMGHSFPTITELKSAYQTVTNELNSHFSTFSNEDWLSKHTAVSDEDFANEPMRNKLNVLISRTTHLSYHLGQMAYLMTK
jgi:uncharacterized damage-inducible protein DinB